MKTYPRTSFVPSQVPPSFFSSSFVHPSKCPSHPRHRPTQATFHRSPPTARVRRGLKPEPIIQDNLCEVQPIKDIDFKPVDFSTFKGKVVFVVNVASEDSYTDSVYSFMARMLDKYQDEGFEVIAFPCNWYGQKETGTHEEIKAFVESKYSNRIRLMSKVNIEWNEVFALAQSYFPGDIIWNFHGKFLFDRTGVPVERFDLLTPEEHIEDSIRRVLAGLPKQKVAHSDNLKENTGVGVDESEFENDLIDDDDEFYDDEEGKRSATKQ